MRSFVVICLIAATGMGQLKAQSGSPYESAADFAKYARKLREQAGLTQQELADRLNVKQPVIGRLEKGKDKRAPRIETLRRIVEALGLQAQIVITEPAKDPGAPILVVKRSRASSDARSASR